MSKTTEIRGIDIDLSPEEMQIYKTYDYDSFGYLKGNRQIDVANYNKLLESMKQEFLVSPIMVNEELKIIDGQHRVEVCRELGYPVYYHIKKGYGIDQVKRANTTSSLWKLNDFMELHISNGIDMYSDFKAYIEQFKISISDLLKVIATFQNKTTTVVVNEFKDGHINFSDEQAHILDFLSSLEDFSMFKQYKTSYFFTAFLKLYCCQEYNHAHMISKLKRADKVLKQQYSIDDYLVILTRDIYSFGVSKTVLFYNKDTKTFHK